MPATIENVTRRKVVVRLSSGESLHLAPRATSREMSDVEVACDKVKKLEQRHVIAVHRRAESPAPRRPRASTGDEGAPGN